MKKHILLLILSALFNVCLISTSVPPSAFKATITKLLEPYQVPMPAQAALATKTFDEWVKKITAPNKPTWEFLAKELLQTLTENRNQIVVIDHLEQVDYSDYAEYRFSILKHQMASLLNQRKQEFLALNQAFKIIDKNALKSETEKKLYDDILTALTPPDEKYIEDNQNKLFKEHIQGYILTTLNVQELAKTPETDLPKKIGLLEPSKVLNAIHAAVTALTEVQRNIELLNAEGSAGLKRELKEKLTKESGWFGYSKTDPALKRIQKELNFLRVQHMQLQIIRDYYIFIISKLLDRKFSPAEETTLKTPKQQFELLKKRRAQEVSWYRYFFPKNPAFGI